MSTEYSKSTLIGFGLTEKQAGQFISLLKQMQIPNDDLEELFDDALVFSPTELSESELILLLANQIQNSK